MGCALASACIQLAQHCTGKAVGKDFGVVILSGKSAWRRPAGLKAMSGVLPIYAVMYTLLADACAPQS